MQLTVFGSTGRMGRHVLAQAARRNHNIVAFTRRPQELAPTPAIVEVVTGDGRDSDAVARAVAGADAVITILGARSLTGPHQVAQIAKLITSTMREAKARRLVITSAYPLVGTTPRVPMALLRLLLARPYADLRVMEAAVSTSGLDWTIARLNRLTDNPAQGRWRMTPDLFDKPASITRGDAAMALLDLAEHSQYAQTAVNLAG